jgi:DNA-binding transcriptional ArsR family regulator
VCSAPSRELGRDQRDLLLASHMESCVRCPAAQARREINVQYGACQAVVGPEIGAAPPEAFPFRLEKQEACYRTNWGRINRQALRQPLDECGIDVLPYIAQSQDIELQALTAAPQDASGAQVVVAVHACMVAGQWLRKLRSGSKHCVTIDAIVSAMREGPDVASLAAVIGDPARANMLIALMSGMALTAGELAREANVTPQTASTHLGKLHDAGFVLMEVQGRHRYYRLASQDVAGALEGLMELAARTGRLRTRPGPRDQAMRDARVCYDHLAGEKGVAMHEAFVSQGLVVATGDGLGLSETGASRFRAEGIDLDALERRGRSPCRACLDWSERRHHLAGPLGAELLRLIFRRGWARREAASRAVVFGPEGLRQFAAFIVAPVAEERRRRVASSR